MDNLPSFDAEKFYLGKLCQREHDYQATGLSLRYRNGRCLECNKIDCKKNYERNPEQHRQRSKDYQTRNRESMIQKRKAQHQDSDHSLDFDVETFYLASLCKHGHDYNGTGFSLRLYVNGVCRECQSIRLKKNYQRDKKQRLKDKKEQYYLYQEEYIQRSKDYQERNREAVRARSKAYAKTEKGLIRSSKGRHKRRASERCVHSAPYTKDDLISVRALFKACAYCGLEKPLTLDHFLPISKGGTDSLGNFVYACLSCNSSKNSADPWLWYSRQTFFKMERWQKILSILGKKDYRQLPLL